MLYNLMTMELNHLEEFLVAKHLVNIVLKHYLFYLHMDYMLFHPNVKVLPTLFNLLL